MATDIARGNVRGIDFLTITLSPISVANASGNEQTFTVNGLKTTDFVYVNKPTVQTGLAVGNCRVSAANTLAIQFINTTSATITPTASEAYTLFRCSAVTLPAPSSLG